MKKTIKTIFLILILFCSIFTINTRAAVPTVTTNDATGVEEQNATLQGTLTDDGNDSYSGIFQNYTTGNDTERNVYFIPWPPSFVMLAQTFTPNITHTITNVTLLLNRTGTPGTLTVRIYSTSNGYPTTTYLASGTTNGNTLPTGPPYEWRTIDLSPCTINSSILYAIVISCSSSTSYVGWRDDSTASTYSNGKLGYSTNSGMTWTMLALQDFMFKESGNELSNCYTKVQYGLTTNYGTNTTEQQKITGETTTTTNIAFRPTSDVSLQLTPSAGGLNYACVDEETLDTADYVYTVNTAPRTDIYGLENHTTQQSDINSITLVLNAKRTGIATPNVIYGALQIDGVNYFSSSSTLTTSWQTFSYTWNNNPDTTTNWTWTDIDSLNIGLKIDISGLSNAGYCSQIYLNISTTYYVDSFNKNIAGLFSSKLYHYRAFANNADGTGYGTDKTFLTKPIPPTLYLLQSNSSTTNYLIWSKGNCIYNYTRIQRKTTGYPTSISDGTNIYNSTGLKKEDTGLTPGQLYYYKLFAFSIWGGLSVWADTNETDYQLTKPNPPNMPSTVAINDTTMNLSWVKGTGANRTVIIRSTTGVPTTPYDGTEIYNSTGTYTIVTVPIGTTYWYRAWSYATWTVPLAGSPPATVHEWSTGYIDFTTQGISINVYNETNPAQAITEWDIEVKNINGSEVYYNTSCNNTLTINETLLPQGEVTIKISKTGYRERIVYTTIYEGIFYTTYFYLPSLTNPGAYQNQTDDCTLRTYINSINITNHSNDAVITLSHQLESIIQTEIYNTGLYGTYGGWLYVPDNKFSYTTTQVTINKTYLDDNTTMARASYYYYDCPSNYLEPQLYYCRVVETIQQSGYIADLPVPDALVTFKRYINTTDSYQTISALKSDADGRVNLWLFPSALYLVTITKDPYTTTYSDYIPQPANIYGQTELKTFRISLTTTGQGIPITETLFTNITYSLQPYSRRQTTAFTVWFNITSYNNQLQWYRLLVYYRAYNSSTWTLLSEQNETNTGGGSLHYDITNTSGYYSVECWFKKTGYSEYEIFNLGSMVYFIVLLKTAIQTVPDYAWFIIMIILMIVTMGFCMMYFSTVVITGYIGLGVMGMMLLMHDVTIYAGDVQTGTAIPISGWVIFGITFLIYTAGLFLWSRQ